MRRYIVVEEDVTSQTGLRITCSFDEFTARRMLQAAANDDYWSIGSVLVPDNRKTKVVKA